MSEQIDGDRRRVLHATMMSIAAAGVGVAGAAGAQSSDAASSGPATSTSAGAHKSFSSLKQIRAGDLDVAYAETGPLDGRPAILLHGWPYDIYSFVDVAPLL